MNKHFLYTNLDNLSTRSKNIINDLGGLEKLLDFYKKHNSFLSISKAGRLSNLELISFCKYLLTKVEEEKKPITIDNSNDKQIENCILYYELEKKFLSTRTINILNTLEQFNDYYSNPTNKIEHITKLFLQNFDFSKLRNAGHKSIIELQLFKKKMQNIDYTIEVLVEEKEEEKEEENKKINRLINKAFCINIDEKDIDELFINGEYSFVKIMCLFLFNNQMIKGILHKVMVIKFFSIQPFDRKLVAKDLNCSVERIRQIVDKLIKTVIPRSVHATQAFFEYKPYDLPVDSEKNILILENLSHFDFKEIAYTPNAELSKIAFSNALKDNYELIDNLISANSKSFITPNINFFVSRKFISNIQLINLLEWLDEQIYQFEIISFEYKLDVLIKRYYLEEKIEISNDALKDLNLIIKNIKKDDFEFENKTSKRLLKRSLIDTVLNDVYLYLKEKHEAQTTKQIIEYLSRKNFEIDNTSLTRYLNNNKTTYVYYGNGNWALNEWNFNNKPTGTFRDIILNLLSTTSQPIHISDLYNYINTMKKVSLHSLRSNLKAETNGTFKFFNCSYVGLSEKKYDEYWYKIPKFEAHHLNKRFFSFRHKEDAQIIKLLSSKYGYPEQHLIFILDLRNGKYR